MEDEQHLDLPIIIHADAPQKPSWQRRIRFAAFLFIAAVSLRIVSWPSKHLEQRPDGTQVVIVDWYRLFDSAYGKPPYWQEQIFPDGSVFEGALVEGLKHGEWKVRGIGGERDVETFDYWHGEEISPVSTFEGGQR